ncbi:DUF5721 family protein [Blautia sp. Sow4_E7]|uniref:DUF5721 family protein n=1 Tax=Blautia sp. Sow4_E7 TaxID=3438749 RepID=UPI003F93AC8C
MLALKITDQKDFTNKLFLGETFDAFWLNQAEIITSNIFSIDGRLQTDFFDNDEQEFLASSHRTFSLWKEVKPFCYSIIRGKRAPLSFKIVLQFSPNKASALLQNSAILISPELVTGLYLNLQYKNKTLLCTTGTSIKTFLPGKELDHLWEQYIADFFRRNELSFEEI